MQEYNQQRKKPTFPATPGICPVCKTRLTGRAITGKYCSTECHDLAQFYQKARPDDIASFEAINQQIAKLESQSDTMPRKEYIAENSNILYKKISLIQRVLKR